MSFLKFLECSTFCEYGLAEVYETSVLLTLHTSQSAEIDAAFLIFPRSILVYAPKRPHLGTFVSFKNFRIVLLLPNKYAKLDCRGVPSYFPSINFWLSVLKA